MIWEVICTYSFLHNFQQGLICFSDSKTTSTQVISTLLHVLQQCTSKHFTNKSKYNYFHNTERGEKKQVPAWLQFDPSQGDRHKSGPCVLKMKYQAVKLPSW